MAAGFRVQNLERVEQFGYAAPGAQTLKTFNVDALPAIPNRCLRVVCISDTHNEHDGIRLPAGDILIHSGDCLTESGSRHTEMTGGDDGATHRARPNGEALFSNFARWFGAQDFEHKVLVPGNHDAVLECMGKSQVQAVLDEHTTPHGRGRVSFLLHEEVALGGVEGFRVFGSPFARYAGFNKAFRSDPGDFSDVPVGVHAIVTHMPPILPGDRGRRQDEDENVVRALHRVGAVLSVSGHCHWAHGLYHSTRRGGGSVPCVVASVCDSHWLHAAELCSYTGIRGDPADRMRGGYNLVQQGIVCDVLVPPSVVAAVRSRFAAAEAGVPAFPRESKPALLFFGPSNDPELVSKLVPMLSASFAVDHVETVEQGVSAVARRRYVSCVAKLGTAGNLGRDVLAALRREQGLAPFVAVHSATAARSAQTRASLESEFAVGVFVEHGQEEQLLDVLLEHIVAPTVLPTVGDWLEGPEPNGQESTPKPALLFFGPPNDRALVRTLLPRLQESFAVDHVDDAQEGVHIVMSKAYAACVAKLGTTGNLGTDVMSELRSNQGATPFIVVHSATACGSKSFRERLEGEFGVNLIMQHGQEEDLLRVLRSHVARSA